MPRDSGRSKSIQSKFCSITYFRIDESLIAWHFCDEWSLPGTTLMWSCGVLRSACVGTSGTLCKQLAVVPKGLRRRGEGEPSSVRRLSSSFEKAKGYCWPEGKAPPFLNPVQWQQMPEKHAGEPRASMIWVYYGLAVFNFSVSSSLFKALSWIGKDNEPKALTFMRHHAGHLSVSLTMSKILSLSGRSEEEQSEEIGKGLHDEYAHVIPLFRGDKYGNGWYYWNRWCGKQI